MLSTAIRAIPSHDLRTAAAFRALMGHSAGVHLDRPNARADERDRRDHVPGRHGCRRCRSSSGARRLDAWTQALHERYQLAKEAFVHADRGPIKVSRHPPPRRVPATPRHHRQTRRLSANKAATPLLWVHPCQNRADSMNTRSLPPSTRTHRVDDEVRSPQASMMQVRVPHTISNSSAYFSYSPHILCIVSLPYGIALAP